MLTCRRFDYERRLLPNPHLAEMEPAWVQDVETAQSRTGLSLGYPGWNLLYFILLYSLPVSRYEHAPGLSRLESRVNVIETGTNRGASTIVMAQALKEAGLQARVQTVEIDSELQGIARTNVAAAGLTDHVTFHVADALAFLKEFDEEVDFIFLDDKHRDEHVLAEFEAIHAQVRGTVYFDNTSRGGVARALREIQRRYGGNLIELANVSMGPPGNAIWQPAKG